ncbi:HK97 family phage prohead protease [Rhodoblastus acidophilus]|uniref:HK97 family phage prohead protease n=1 Tax=Rhodoblastus acidophilus TaxID=1074 RepID=A0A6N8DIQ0_RHOAC|nr:HK97 family phage prohead protease [Rhodoblastus acidophilus]MCW2273315.1 HK97 family phage prohead protease [Rhodoblastus acidophilus]MTV30207.1 HK97 family phage prohead protease [Rhodoblastus acidophilus]
MIERRTYPLEIRTARGNPRRLEGYAATFGAEARIGDFVETIRQGAFADSLAAGRDILALVDHDPTRVLGRTRSGTLRLGEDARGLQFSVDLPDTQAARDVLALAERGDIGGMSFGFDVEDDGDEWTGQKRELRKVNLHEISVVSAWPAYDGTIVQTRSALAPGFVTRNLARRYLDTLRG